MDPFGDRPVVSPALVGRDAELAALVAAVTAPPSVVVVEGEAGIGKTRLLAELRDQPQLAELRFLTGWCRPVREPFPLGPVIEAVRVQGPQLVVEALSPVVGALRPLLPELADRFHRHRPRWATGSLSVIGCSALWRRRWRRPTSC